MEPIAVVACLSWPISYRTAYRLYPVSDARVKSGFFLRLSGTNGPAILIGDPIPYQLIQLLLVVP